MKQRDMGIGIGLVVLGLFFLFGPALNLATFGWPFFVIIPGVILLFIAFTGRVGNGALAVPGAIVTVTGLILLVLNLTGRMEAWAYAWALVMAGAGTGVYLHGTISGSDSLKRTGRRGALLGILIFVLMGLVFELFIFGTLSAVLRWLIPVALLLAGGLLLYRGSQKPSSAAPARTAPPPAPPAGTQPTPPPAIPPGQPGPRTPARTPPSAPPDGTDPTEGGQR